MAGQLRPWLGAPASREKKNPNRASQAPLTILLLSNQRAPDSAGLFDAVFDFAGRLRTYLRPGRRYAVRLLDFAMELMPQAPVKLVLNRFEEHTCTGNRPAALMQFRAAVDGEGDVAGGGEDSVVFRQMIGLDHRDGPRIRGLPARLFGGRAHSISRRLIRKRSESGIIMQPREYTQVGGVRARGCDRCEETSPRTTFLAPHDAGSRTLIGREAAPIRSDLRET